MVASGSWEVALLVEDRDEKRHLLFVLIKYLEMLLMLKINGLTIIFCISHDFCPDWKMTESEFSSGFSHEAKIPTQQRVLSVTSSLFLHLFSTFRPTLLSPIVSITYHLWKVTFNYTTPDSTESRQQQ